MRRRCITKKSSQYSGGSGTANDPFRIGTLSDVRQLSDNVSHWGRDYVYAQTADIDMSETSNWNGGLGFSPIGSESNPFSGIYNGLGHSMTGLYINRPNDDNVGLFGSTAINDFEIKNLRVLNVSITGGNYVAAILGSNFDFSTGVKNIEECTSSGTVISTSGTGSAAGIVSVINQSGSIIKCESSCLVSGSRWCGGIVSILSNSSNATKCVFNGTVGGTREIGGIIGYLTVDSNVNQCTSGLNASINGTDNYSYVGGIVGQMGDRTGDTSSINNSHSEASVTGNNYKGGLLGHTFYPTAQVLKSYWNPTDSAPATSSIYGIQSTQSDMKQQATYIDWDFVNVWDIDPSTNNGYPFLR